jgi:hypothetical protein
MLGVRPLRRHRRSEMPKDPLKIIGKPNPTPEEREQAEALAKRTGRPAKMCRAALLETKHDVKKATALLDDPEFVRMNTDFDLGKMARLAADNPMAMAEYMMRQHAAHAGMSEEDLGDEFKQVQSDAAAYEAERPNRKAYEKREREARGRKLQDPVFGKLTWDTLWSGRVEVPGFGRLPVTVDADTEPYAVATPPGEEHREALTKFLAAAEKLRPKIEKANFDYFKRVRDIYAEGGGDVPDVRKAADLWDELSSPELHVPVQDGKSWRVEMTWNCSWDEEHGHAVYIEGGKVVNVSIQGDGYEAD